MGEDAGVMRSLGLPWDLGELILHPCHTAAASSLSHASALPQGCSKSERVVMEWFGATHMARAM